MVSRAIVVSDFFGDPHEVLKIVTTEKPKAFAGNVVVHFTLRPVNPSDYRAHKTSLPHLQGNDIVVGSEDVGCVDEVGDGATKVKRGQRVVPEIFRNFSTKGIGSWQDYAEFAEDKLFVLPDSIPDEGTVHSQSIDF